MPTTIGTNDDGYIIITELVSRDVYDNTIFLKPSVRLAITSAKNIIKAAVAIFFEIIRKEKRYIATTSERKISQGNYSQLRLPLFDGFPKNHSKRFKFIYCTVCHQNGEIFINKSYPFDIDNLLKKNMELTHALEKLEKQHNGIAFNPQADIY